MHEKKRARGQYFTVSKSPFGSDAFKKWADKAGLPNEKVLEPFAGANNIINSLRELKLCINFDSYDIAPAVDEVRLRDTIKSFPIGVKVCITNPPWLARNSATRRRLPFPTCPYDDIYKFCLKLCLENCEFIAALVPASYLQSGLFRDRLQTYILLHDLIFEETKNPVCLALFDGKKTPSTDIYYDNRLVGKLDELEMKIPVPIRNRCLRFNDPNGQLGFISFDNTRERSIRFCDVSEIDEYEIKESSRFITRIGGEFDNASNLIVRLNEIVNKFRDETWDLFLTPFKGIRDDGQYRRRMFFSQARSIINAA